MSTNSQCGYDGSISFGAEVVEWTLDQLVDAIEATSMDSAGYKEFIPCLESAEGTFTTLDPSGVPGMVTSATFANDIHTYDLDLIITNVTIGTPVDGRVSYRYSWISTGEVTVS